MNVTGGDAERFTLNEARVELKRRECAMSRHAPALELPSPGDRASVWLCDCNAFTFTPLGRALVGAVEREMERLGDLAAQFEGEANDAESDRDDVSSRLAAAEAEIERLRAAVRRRGEAPTDEKLADFVARANRNQSSRPWRIVGYLARCMRDERDKARLAAACPDCGGSGNGKTFDGATLGTCSACGGDGLRPTEPIE